MNKADEAIQQEAEQKAIVRRNKLGRHLRALDIEHYTTCNPSLIKVSVADLEMLLWDETEEG